MIPAAPAHDEARRDALRQVLVPRTVPQCIDLGWRFCASRIGLVLGLWALCAIPVVAIVFLTWRWQTPWGVMIAATMLATGLLGVMLVKGFLRPIRGEKTSVSQAVPAEPRDWGLLCRVLLMRAVIVVVFYLALRIPNRDLRIFACFGWACFALWPLSKTSLAAEKTYLASLDVDATQSGQKQAQLLRRESGTLIGGRLALLSFYLTVSTLLFVAIDLGSEKLFNSPIWHGRVWKEPVPGELVDRIELFDRGRERRYIATQLFFRDPYVLSLQAAVLLLAYVPCRLAWMFVYLDLRVRRDCWDLELRLSDEAKRLQT